MARYSSLLELWRVNPLIVGAAIESLPQRLPGAASFPDIDMTGDGPEFVVGPPPVVPPYWAR